MTKLLLLAAAVLPLAACADPTPDVVGTWRQVPDANDDPVPEDERTVITFADDGTFMRDDRVADLPVEEGTYELADGRISLTSAEVSFDVAYAVDASIFLFGILEPDDDGADAVATWSGYSESSDNGRLDNVITLGDDHTAHVEQTTDDGTSTYDGTWAQTGDDVEVTVIPEENFTITMSATLHAGLLGTAYEAI